MKIDDCVAIVTGANRGIGEAFVRLLLQNDDAFVTGISRSNQLQHERFQHVEMDLADPVAVSQFVFEAHVDATECVLFNNAGTLGEIGPVGQVTDKSIQDAFQINLVSPAILTNQFMAADLGVNVAKVVINVSSGAGKRPIDGWATYCATKAGLDLFSQTVEAEEQLHDRPSARVLSVAPGIVDTDMQSQIRQSEEAEFSRIEDFIEYKNSGKLADPATVALKYLHILNNLDQFPDTLYTVRDIEL